MAVLTRVNEPAERYGQKPYDFVATFHNEGGPQLGEWAQEFESPAQGNALREDRFEKLLAALGIVGDDRLELIGAPARIIDTLDNALQLAPKQRPRF